MDSVHNFEELLKQRANKQLPKLYNSENVNKTNRTNFCQKDVISRVNAQIKAIQSADCVNKKKCVNKYQIKSRNSEFLPVNMLKVSEEVQQKKNKFDTQLELNTELIYIIENPEVACNGITQEFNTSFDNEPNVGNRVENEIINDINPKINSETSTDRLKDVHSPNRNGEDVKQGSGDTSVGTCGGLVPEKYIELRQDDDINSKINKETLLDKLKDVQSYNNAIEDKYIEITELRQEKITEGFDAKNKFTKTSNNVEDTVNSNLEEITELTQFNMSSNNVEWYHANNSSKTQNYVEDYVDDNIEISNKDATEYVDAKNNCPKTNDNEIDLQDFNTDISPSPVLNINKAHKTLTSPFLICNLDSFEKFEEIAIPIVEETNDMKKAKYLINSQIIGKELFIQTDRIDKAEQLSPVLQVNKENTKKGNLLLDDITNLELIKNCKTFENEILLCNKDNLIEKTFKETNINADLDKVLDHETNAETSKIENEISINNKKRIPNTKLTDKSHLNKVIDVNTNFETSKTFEDEILFSSDEELDREEFNDVPLTCALETSFYNESDVLDKTMFVGFQTASNRSIQISTESFTKAKSILDLEIDVSLKELVDKCDSFKVTNNVIAKDTSQVNNRTCDDDLYAMDEDNTSKVIDRDKENPKINKTLDRFNMVMDNFGGKIDENLDLLHNVDEFQSACDKNINNENFNDVKSVLQSNNNIGLNNESLSKAKSSKDIVNVGESADLKKHLNDIFRSPCSKYHFNKPRKLDGFKTASNKNIVLSDKALARCKRVFQDIDIDEDFNDETSDRKRLKTFEKNEIGLNSYDLASGIDNIKQVNIGKDRDKNATFDMNFEKGINTENEFEKELIDLNLTKIDIESKGNIDKNIGNLKKYIDTETVTTETIDLNLTKIDEDILKEFEGEMFFDEKKNIGFKTASNKNIKISNEALVKTKNMFDDIVTDISETGDYSSDRPETNLDDSKDGGLQNKLCENNVNSNLNYIGFKTASNKNINITKEALDKIRNIFHDIEFTDLENQKSDNHVISSSRTTVKSDKFGFKTPKIPENVVFNKVNNISYSSETTAISIENTVTEERRNKLICDIGIKTPKVLKDVVSINTTDASNKEEKTNLEKVITEYKIEDFNQPFIGFQIANNNNKITISKTALAKTANIFHDIDANYAETSNNKEDNRESIIVIHDRKLSEEFNLEFDSNVQEDLSSNTSANKVASGEFMKEASRGFEDLTNSNKEVSRDIGFENEATNKINNITSEKVFIGFHTANNKPVTISDAALAKSKTIFEDLYDKNIEDNADDVSDKLTCENDFIGFHTASNKPVKISDKALAKSKSIFEDFDKNEKDNLQSNTLTTGAFKGFHTASNKPVKISDAALAKSKIIFDDFDKAEQDNLRHKTLASGAFKGFHTASNKPVNISDAALAKSRTIFEDFDRKEQDNVQNNTSPSGAFKGFHTASNKPVKISDEALEKSKTIFENYSHERTDSLIENKKKVNNDLASERHYKDMPISSCEKFEVSELSKIGNKKNKSIVSFKTANNNKVLISEDAIIKSKKILHDFSTDIENNSFCGFQTANNKKVAVSEDSLRISKSLLNNASNRDSENVTKSTIKIEAINNSTINFKTKINKINENIKEQNRELKFELNEKALKDNSELLDTNIINFEEGDPRSNISELNKEAAVNPEKLIDTQIMHNFEEALNTEDFLATPKLKRSASPILSCSKIKKRKFTTPYTKRNICTEVKIHTVTENEYFDLNYKKNKIFKLIDLKHNIKDDKFNINYDDLLNFEFNDHRNDIDGSKFTINDIKDYFLKLVNKKLIPNNWLENHLQLILWKLISYEMRFECLNNICTVSNVLKQLYYRYNRELYNAERPAIRKILERDDVASKIMVLCVVKIDGRDNDTASTPELLLTDGWYCIKACIDKMLTKYVNNGKIRVGIKLVTHGAELLNCEQGIAPWEDTSSVRLKLFGNSSRRARWDARLGYHGNGAILSQLSSVKADGGKVSKLKVFVTRVYPPLYVEKFEDGSTVTRSERLEHIYQMKYESDRQAVMEKLYEEVEREMSDEEPLESQVDYNKLNLDSGSQIAKLMKICKESSQFRANLTTSQKRLLTDHTEKSRHKVLQDIQTKVRSKMVNAGLTVVRNVVPLLKVRVVGVEEKNGRVEIAKALLSIWKPNDALSEIITEGAWIEIRNVVPTALRYSELQLSAGRQTLFKKTTVKVNDKFTQTLNRINYPIKQLRPNTITDYNEIDTIGIIFHIEPNNRDFQTLNQFQNVYLSDENKNFICINFWGGIKKFGFENILERGQIVACMNLQKRAGNTRKNIQQYRATEFTYFTKTPKNVATRKNIDMLSKIINNQFLKECMVLYNYKTNESPYRYSNNRYNNIDSPKIQDFNLSGLDFDSTFKDTGNSPKELLRKKKMNEKIAKLKMYGEPPPLSPINIINISKNATKSYKSPLINNVAIDKNNPNVATLYQNDLENYNPLNNVYHSTGNTKELFQNDNSICNSIDSVSDNNVANAKNNCNIVCSPVLSVKRMYNKNINPVKLNFCEEMEVDHFAEEFDPSPPLSLD